MDAARDPVEGAGSSGKSTSKEDLEQAALKKFRRNHPLTYWVWGWLSIMSVAQDNVENSKRDFDKANRKQTKCERDFTKANAQYVAAKATCDNKEDQVKDAKKELNRLEAAWKKQQTIQTQNKGGSPKAKQAHKEQMKIDDEITDQKTEIRKLEEEFKTLDKKNKAEKAKNDKAKLAVETTQEGKKIYLREYRQAQQTHADLMIKYAEDQLESDLKTAEETRESLKRKADEDYAKAEKEARETVEKLRQDRWKIQKLLQEVEGSV